MFEKLLSLSGTYKSTEVIVQIGAVRACVFGVLNHCDGRFQVSSQNDSCSIIFSTEDVSKFEEIGLHSIIHISV